jgi:hypothetical protein
VPGELLTLALIVGVGLWLPGVILVAISTLVYRQPRLQQYAVERRATQLAGIAFVVTASLMIAWLLALGLSPQSGGLGSMGNPLGAIALLLAVHVVVPLALVMLLGSLILVTIRSLKCKTQHRR